MNTLKPSSRMAFALGAATCALLLGFAYYLQYVQMQDPCPLCMVQRVAYYALGAVLLVAALHGPARGGAIAYGLLALLVAALGAAVATRHVWLQHLPKDMVPACGPGLEYMLKRFPLSDVLTKLLAGSGECAEAGWTFLGLTIAGWSLLWFVVFGVGAAWIVISAWRRS